MSLLDQSAWWLVPYALLVLLVLHAMMEFTASLLVQRPRRNTKPVGAQELRQRLLALNDEGQPYPLVEGADCDLEIAWEAEEPAPEGRYALASRGSSGRLRFLLDEVRHELRMNQVTRAHSLIIGLAGWLPRLEVFFGFQAGPPGEGLTDEIRRTALRSGWSVRPVLWWFQATRSGVRWLERLTPAPVRRMPARRFWGILYPLSFVAAMGYIAYAAGPMEGSDVLLLLGISAAWWGVWGLLVWAMLGFPRFWR